MDKFALIGTGIAHSQSPRLFSNAYGGRYEYDLIDREDFNSAWEEFLSGPYKAINITSPFKELAAARCIQSPEVERIGAANIAVKTAEGIISYNSDYRGVLYILRGLALQTDMPGIHDCGECNLRSAVVVGFGGAGKAALQACRDFGLEVTVMRHWELEQCSARADIIIYTLPSEVPGARKMKCRFLLEANYKDPVFAQSPLDGAVYIPGTEWLAAQALQGYELMTGEAPISEELL